MTFAALAVVAGCSLSPCAVTSGTLGRATAFDISGASNSPCTVIVARGGTTRTFQIAAPTPPTTETSLDVRAPLADCDGGDAGVSVAVTPSDGVSATRTSTQLCFVVSATAANAFGISTDTDCGVTLTLSCSLVTLYDRVPWQLCQVMMAC